MLYVILALVLRMEMHSAFLGTLVLLVFLAFYGIANIIFCVLVFHELSWMGMCQEEGVIGVPTVQPSTPALCSAGVPAQVCWECCDASVQQGGVCSGSRAG